MGAISPLFATLVPQPFVIPLSNGSGLLDDWVTPGLTNPMIADQDMIVGGIAGAPTRLAVGPIGYVLTVGSAGIIDWEVSSGGFSNPMTTSQDLIVGGASGAPGRLGVGSHGQVLTVGSSGIIDWETPAATGVTTVSVVSANGFAGSVANPTTTPAITITTTITGVLKGNGTAISAASAGTDYVAPGSITTSGLTMATAKMLGRATAGTGAIQEIAVTGSGSAVLATSPALVTPDLGTPTAGVLSSCTGLPISTGVSGLGSGIATFLTTPSSANLASAVTDETGTGKLVFGTAPTFASTMTVGTAGGTTGAINFVGTTSGTVTLSVADAAGTNTFKLPATAGSNTNVLATDGSGNLFWQAGSGAGTVNSGTATNVAYYAATGAAVSGSATITISATGRVGIAPTLVTSGVVPYLTITAPADTTLTAGTEAIGISFVAAGRQHASNTTVGKQREIVFTAPTYSFASATGTITVAATVAIEAAPIVGTAAAITNTAALWIQAGDIIMGDGVAGANLVKIAQASGVMSISGEAGIKLLPYRLGPTGVINIVGNATDLVCSDSSSTATWQGSAASGRGVYVQRVGNAAASWLLSVHTSPNADFGGFVCGGAYGALTATATATSTTFRGFSYGGTTWAGFATISLTTTQTQSETARGGQIVFKTVPNSSTTLTAALTLDQDQTATFGSSIKTSAPSGGTAGAWKTGILVTAAVVPDTTRYIQLDVGGTLYKLIVST